MTLEILYLLVACASALAWAWLRQPAWSVPLLTAVSLLAGEFYPLSDYPMYSDPDGRENYLYIARVDGHTYEPVPVRTLTGVTAPKVKKMYKARLRSRSTQRRPTIAEQSAAGTDLLEFLRGQANARGRSLPERVALVEVWIVHDGVDGYHERMQVIAVDARKTT